MIVTMPSGRRYFAPLPTPITWSEQAPSVIGSAIVATDLERDIGTAIAFHSSRPLFQGITTTATNIATSTWTPIALGEIIDSYGGHNDSSNPSRVSADVTGSNDDWYLCSGYVPLNGVDPGHVGIGGLRLSGGTIFEGQKTAGATGHANTQIVCDLLRMPIGAYVELMGWQNSGSTQTTVVAGKTPSLTVRWACSAAGDVVGLPAMPRTWTAQDVLTADSTGTNKVPLNVVWRDVLRFLRYPPVARIHSIGTTQTLASGGWQTIAFGGESIDNYGGHDNVTNNSRYTCQRAGLYYVYGLAAVTEPAVPAGYRASRLLVNGTTPYGGMSTMAAVSTTAGTALPASALLRLNAGDYVELQMMHNQGTALSVRDGTGDCSRLIALWMSL